MNELEDDELSVDLTPLIDVTFMLVIFFIMTMSFTLPVIDFTLPQSATAQVENQGHNLRIGVNSAGVFSVNNVVYPESELGRIVEEHVIAAQAQQQELTLELVIDADAPTQYLITVADLARTYTQGRLMVVSEKTDNSTAPAPATSETAITAPAPTTTTTTTTTDTNAAPAAATPAANAAAPATEGEGR